MSLSIVGAPFWRTPGLMAVLAALNADGEEARVVGGAVRNTLLGLPVSDVDIATTAVPEVVAERARKAGLKPVPTGVEHGTVTVVADHHAFEVTTLREDMETDGRRAVVRFGRNWLHDAERRDFTLNALYATADGAVVDLVGGLSDLTARRIRFIGDPQARIREDYLRILRLFRFHAAYGAGPVDREAFIASVRLRAGLLTLSRERVRAEMLKLLVAPGAAATLAVMSDAGLLQPLIAGIADVGAFTRLATLERAWQAKPDPIRRLAALAVRVSDDAVRLRERLRLSNAEARRLAALSATVPDLPDARAVRAFLYRNGVDAALDLALLAAAHGRGGMEAVAAMAASWMPPRLPFAAADLMALGLTPGRALGAALARAEARWIAADFPTDPAVVSSLLAEAARTSSGA
ncbi:CCA tRNA nucleotidyltransferase [Xanthobacter oligotrophicus]|uniref:CCA tRNA nucleotidyltransferase n=1 Tax=Xanthobacter oligotrophicus TaxID=2607286 RepID=UPI0011F2E667|nr:CCA tRNA nucleotidyltransferase [Xanthobacter oligotrophicus]MCG5236108.1 CCA tRNA nucleotidyltransferase [Xanthobacter oligotrophicus]